MAFREELLPPPSTLPGVIKRRCQELEVTLGSLAPLIGMKAESIRARLSKSRGKRSLQPWQVSRIADALGLPRDHLHRLAARHEGWEV